MNENFNETVFNCITSVNALMTSMSIGTEHIDDIIADLEAGFAAVRGE